MNLNRTVEDFLKDKPEFKYELREVEGEQQVIIILNERCSVFNANGMDKEGTLIQLNYAYQDLCEDILTSKPRVV